MIYRRIRYSFGSLVSLPRKFYAKFLSLCRKKRPNFGLSRLHDVRRAGNTLIHLKPEISMKPRYVLLLLLLCPIFVHAAIKSEPIEYKQGDTTFQGALYYDDADAAPRRAVLVCHEWWGLNED